MRAVTVVDGHLELRDHPDPEPGPGQVLVAVRSAGINNADLGQRDGHYPAPPDCPPDIPGLELAGEVVAAGPGTSRFRTGDRVMALVGGGAQAELAVVPECLVMPLPDGLPWDQAGGFPEAFVTAHDGLFSQCGLRLGERVAVHAGAGGVGTAAVQLAVCAGADVTATVRSEQVRPQVAELGARVSAPEDFAQHAPYDVILELVGAAGIPDDLKALALGGRISVLARASGARAEVDFSRLMALRARIHGASLRNRPLESKAAAIRLVEHEVLPLIAAGRVRVPVHRSFGFDEAREAYEEFSRPGKFGKLLLHP
jgi:NADPH2:quinone reductase